MRYFIEPISGNLVVVADDEVRATLRERNDNPDYNDLHSDEVLFDTFEPLICNSELQWVSPEEFSALTSAPIIGIYDETGTNVEKAWWYPGYELRSPQQDLLETGKCVFKKAME